MSNAKTNVILNGEIIPQTEANVPVTSRGLLYGDGCFETFRSYAGRFLEIQSHLKRLAEGLTFLSIQYPADLKSTPLISQLQSLLIANDLMAKDAIIRIQLWREGGRGYGTTTLGKANYSITVTPFHPKITTYKLATVDIRKVPSTAVPARLKLSNGINHIIAACQAMQKGADDALLETIDHFISETTIANIFWLKNDIVFTPSLSCDILPGVTRGICIKLLQERLKTEVKEDAFILNDIKNAETIWICNSLREIQPVGGIDDTNFDTAHSFTQALMKVFEAYKEKQLLK